MGLLLVLAARNLVSHRGKSLIVGTIMALGTALVVVALGLLDGVETAMRRSITGSVAADFQLYDGEARDPLILLGSSFISVPEVGQISRFEDVEKSVSGIPGVQAVVPMGFGIASIVAQSSFERSVERLGKTKLEGDRRQIVPELRALVNELFNEFENRMRIAADPERLQRTLAELQLVKTDAFWERVVGQEKEALEYLDTRVAPLAEGGRRLLFRFLGTNFESYRQHFGGFKITKGKEIPHLTRGLLMSDRFYEHQVKHRVARLFDLLVEHAEDGETIRDDAGQQSRVRRMVRQWRRIARELDSAQSQELRLLLKDILPSSPDDELPTLLQEFLRVDDSSLEERHAYFYAAIAPRIQLYSVRPGDMVTMRSFTRTGFSRSVNIKFFGTFSFDGLESSDLAGIYNVTDLVTFRRLSGVMTAQDRKELGEIRAQIALRDVGREDAEAIFFGEASDNQRSPQSEIEVIPQLEEGQFAGADTRGLSETIEQLALETGYVQSAAVVVKPEVSRKDVRRALESHIDEAGLKIQVTDWQAAAGLIGQFIIVVRVVLYIALAIIFGVAIVIINNALVMTTMERVSEIGTLRAIGAKRSQVVIMFFLETILLGVLSGVVGMLIGGLLIEWWHQNGLNAPNRELRFLFGGPKLYPELSLVHVLMGFVSVLMVGVVSTLYPAILGASIQPVDAIRTGE